MKNILFATTALVATAGFAQAEVTGSGAGTIDITGKAEIGVFGGEFFTTNVLGQVNGNDEIVTQFHTDIDVTFKMEGTADNGLTFGATVDLDEGGAISNATQNDADDGGATFFISGGGATLTMGDTDGAFDKAMREVSYAGGSIQDNEEHIAWGGFGNNGLDGFYDGQIARFDYSFDTVTASLSAEIDDSGNDDPVWGLGVRYEGDLSGVALGVGLGFQAVNDDNYTFFGTAFSGDLSIIGLSVDAGFSNGVTTGFTYTVADADGTEANHVGLGVAYEMNALAIGLNYGRNTFDGDVHSSGVGLAAEYDMGGGLAAQLGYNHNTLHEDFTSGSDESYNTWSLGLAMSF
ncbi:MAG: porin [Rhodobacteraceae bacterium]|nr:MAG: porin [Paracoccaceae bacterium]